MAATPDGPDELAQDAAVGDFVEMWGADRQHGTKRSLLDYLARFPGHEDAIAREYSALTAPSLPSTIEAGAVTADRCGPYRLLGLLGQGGQGAVWLAEDTRLGRRVALKVLSSQAVPVTTGRLERLRREALALARLAHPGICAIHEAHLEGSQPYLAMQLVEGATLATLQQRRTGAHAASTLSRDDLRAWIEFFRQAALAMHAAHALGILHRDIKPGNLMRTPGGAPVLLDFGLAHDLEANAMVLTQSGELFGTLPYMAPEILAARPRDQRADIYALAVTMYEVLAGHLPFVGATEAALRQAITAGVSTRLDRVCPAVSRDLAVVVATAMEHDPERRYTSAAALAEDLGNVLADAPIAVMPVGRWTQLRRWVRRHPALSSSFTLLVAGLLVAVVLLAMLAEERTRLLALRQAHLAQRLAAEQPGLALFAATQAAETARHPEIHDVLYQVLDRCWEEHAVIDDLALSAIESTTIVITADDRHLVRTIRGGAIQIVDLEQGRIVRTLPIRPDGRTRAALGEGDALLVGGADGTVRRLDLDTGSELWSKQVHASAVADAWSIVQLVVAPARRRFASCGADGQVVVFDLEGGLVGRCLGHTGGVTMAAFAPDAQRLATLGGKLGNVPFGDKCVRVFAADGGTLLHTFGPFPTFPHWLCWSGDGRQLAIGCDTGIEVHDLVGGALRTVPNAAPVHWVEFTPGDRGLVFGSAAGLCVYDLATAALVVQHQDFQGRSVYRGAFSHDGEQLAIIAWDDSARIYDTTSWRQQQVFRGVLTRSLGVGWNRRGDRLYTVGGCLQSWYVGTRPFLPVAKGLTGRLVSAHFTARGDRIVAANADGEVRVWDADPCNPVATLHASGPLREVKPVAGERLLLVGDGVPTQLVAGNGGRVHFGSAAASDGWLLGDDRVVLTVGGDAQVYDATSGELLRSVQCHRGSIATAALHPSKPWLLTGGHDRSFCLVDVEHGQILHRPDPWRPGSLGDDERVLAFAFTASGDRVAVSCEDLAVRIVDLQPGYTTSELRMAPTPGRLLFSGDGDALFVGAMWSGKLYCHDASTLALRQAHSARHANLLVALQRQPDGPLALSASKDGVVAVFDANHDVLISVIHATSAALVAACFRPGGSQLLTADENGEVRLWPLDPLAVARRVCPQRHATSLQAR